MRWRRRGALFDTLTVDLPVFERFALGLVPFAVYSWAVKGRQTDWRLH